MTGNRRRLSADEVNANLRELYLEVWPHLLTLIPDDESFSNPLLVKVKQAYCDAPYRIVVVGQQTDTWYNNVRARELSDPVGALMDIYDRFDLARPHRERRYSPYWWASHHLSKSLNGKSAKADFVWTDLVRIDHGRCRPSQKLEAEFCGLGMLRRELQLLAPDVVLFFTGPKYEVRLQKTFSGVKYAPVSSQYDARWLARLTHEALPRATFRTYHPGYLQRTSRYDVIKSIPAFVRQVPESHEKMPA